MCSDVSSFANMAASKNPELVWSEGCVLIQTLKELNILTHLDSRKTQDQWFINTTNKRFTPLM